MTIFADKINNAQHLNTNVKNTKSSDDFKDLLHLQTHSNKSLELLNQDDYKKAIQSVLEAMDTSLKNLENSPIKTDLKVLKNSIESRLELMSENKNSMQNSIQSFLENSQSQSTLKTKLMQNYSDYMLFAPAIAQDINKFFELAQNEDKSLNLSEIQGLIKSIENYHASEQSQGINVNDNTKVLLNTSGLSILTKEKQELALSKI
ncbi:hypothetical protein CQA38_03020 [Campylobacter sp. MIT 12-5580]|uniref:hypothetical protein n=1 Tax=Campylobacter sp. MIT 12-5580 TaxID=2040651 RepID=UPI0010F4DFDF|nr:hypothetical protein [Campylobacter sp. MIT 12-5580]TKX29760.1 hypothetical protein CQA38_03020 [Campylobacter sp. MIT 12-5580]